MTLTATTLVITFLLGVGLALALVPIHTWARRTFGHPGLPEKRQSRITRLMYLAVQGSPSGILVVDPTGQVIMSNPQASRLGIIRRAAVAPEVQAAVEEVFRTGTGQTKGLSLDLPHSRVQSLSLDLQPLTLDRHFYPTPAPGHTSPSYVIVHAWDESENVRMEKARRDFVANVSHELKTPLGAISLLSEALLDDPSTVDYFGPKIQHEALRMANLVEELIDLSKLQGTEKLPELTPTPIEPIIKEAIARLTSDELIARVTTNLQPNPPRVLADSTLLTIAINNLLVNALNYSPPGSEVTITTTTNTTATNNTATNNATTNNNPEPATLTISVTDHGIGIHPKHHARVFERFFRVDKARSRSTGGTGLGLAIVKHIVYNHGGTIHLESAPGLGSTFSIQLPAAD